MSRKTVRSLLAASAALLAACGSDYGSSGGGATAPGYFLVISNMTFTPLELAVPPGATVTVVNRDAMAHSVTSEAVAGDFTPGAVAGVSFDTGAFTGTVTFTIPASAQDGTVVPYYCSTHLGTMTTPNGTIRIASEAQPGPAPEPGGPGGY